jgi:hypothetical protein
LAQVELARVQLGEMGNELDRGFALGGRENDDAAEEIRVGQPGRRGVKSAVPSLICISLCFERLTPYFTRHDEHPPVETNSRCATGQTRSIHERRPL